MTRPGEGSKLAHMRRFSLLLIAVVAAGCASWPRLTTPPLAPPAGAEFFTASDGARLFSKVEGAGERGVVWFVLGPEISSAPPVPALAAALRDAGFATAVVHPRGTGFSDGLRGDTADYPRFLSDYRDFLAALQAPLPFIFSAWASASEWNTVTKKPPS